MRKPRVIIQIILERIIILKTLFTWSGGPRSSGVGFFCFVSSRASKQKMPTPLDRGPPLHVNKPLERNWYGFCAILVLKTVLGHFDLKSSIVFEGATMVYEHIYRLVPNE